MEQFFTVKIKRPGAPAQVRRLSHSQLCGELRGISPAANKAFRGGAIISTQAKATIQLIKKEAKPNE